MASAARRRRDGGAVRRRGHGGRRASPAAPPTSASPPSTGRPRRSISGRRGRRRRRRSPSSASTTTRCAALDISVAAHSPLVEPILDEFGRRRRAASRSPGRDRAGVEHDRRVRRRRAHRPSTTGGATCASRCASPTCSTRCAQAGCTTFVEIGPHPTLLGLGRRNWPDADGDVGAVDAARAPTSWSQMATGAGHAPRRRRRRRLGGVRRPRSRRRRRRRVDLPTYPWQRAVATGRPRRPVARPPARRHRCGRRPRRPPREPGRRRGPLDLDVGDLPGAVGAARPARRRVHRRRARRARPVHRAPARRHTCGDLVGQPVVSRAGYEPPRRRGGWTTSSTTACWCATATAIVAPAPLPDGPTVDAARRGRGRLRRHRAVRSTTSRRCGEQLAAVVSGRETRARHAVPRRLLRDGRLHLRRLGRAPVLQRHRARRRRPPPRRRAPAGRCGSSRSAPAPAARRAAVLPALPADGTATRSPTSPTSSSPAPPSASPTTRFVRYARLDIEAAAGDAGLRRRRTYDVVVAANVLHATRDLDAHVGPRPRRCSPRAACSSPSRARRTRAGSTSRPGSSRAGSASTTPWRTDVPLIDAGALAAGAGGGRLRRRRGPARRRRPRPRRCCSTSSSPAPPATRRRRRAPPGDGAGTRRAGRGDGGRARRPRRPGPAGRRLADERHGVLVDAVRQAVAHVLRIADPGRLAPRPAAARPRLRLADGRRAAQRAAPVAGAGAKLPATLVFDHPTIAAIADLPRDAARPGRAGGQCRAGGGARAPAVPPARAVSTLGDVAELSDDEVEAMLLRQAGGDRAMTDGRRPSCRPLKRALLALDQMQAQARRAPSGRAASRSPSSAWAAASPAAPTTPTRSGSCCATARDAVAEVPADRWDVDGVLRPRSRRARQDVDARRAGSSATSTASTRSSSASRRARRRAWIPQQRLLLEVAWEALEHAGIAPDRLGGQRAPASSSAMTTSDYAQVQLRRRRPRRPRRATTRRASAHSIAAGRLSYVLGLQGPSIAVDTACSSSLVAVHLACRACGPASADLALAGGVNLMLSPENSIALSKVRMMAPDGRCKTFDAAADGFVRGEGCGVVVLKRLARRRSPTATASLAVIRGSAVNQDGASSGLTAPNGPAQEAVVREALADGGVGAGDGRLRRGARHRHGARRSDRGAGAGRRAAARVGRPSAPLAIGSVKTNIGHLEAAAGVAGLIKVVLVAAARRDPAAPAPPRAQPAHRLGDAAGRRPDRADAVARPTGPRAGRRQRVRLQRHQRARRAGGGAGAGAAGRVGPPTDERPTARCWRCRRGPARRRCGRWPAGTRARLARASVLASG